MKRLPIVFFLLARAAAAQPTEFSGTLVFLNRCPGTCTFTQGPSDSVANTTPLASSGNRVISEFSGQGQTFATVVDCVRSLLSPFAVTVTTTDPSPAPHTEIVIAGTASELGLASVITEIAPAGCSFLANAPAFVFANPYADETERICWAAARQVGILTGLDYHRSCADVMSGSLSCATKSFLDQAVNCGVLDDDACRCGGTAENSFQQMVSTFAARSVFVDGFESGNTSAWQ